MAVPTRALPVWVTHAGVHVIAKRAFPGGSWETAFPGTEVPCAEVKGAIGLGSPLAASLCTAGAGSRLAPNPNLSQNFLCSRRGGRGKCSA